MPTEGTDVSKQRHTLVVQVEDQPGVLNRVVSLMRRRSFNIDSITVGHSETPGISRMTIVVVGETAEVEQVGKQLYKIIEVLKVTDLEDENCVARELALIKVAAKAQTRGEILQIAQIYGAKVLDASPSTLLIEATGAEEKIDSLLTMLRGFGIRELVRSGRIAMVRGGGSTVSAKGSGSLNGTANGHGRSETVAVATLATVE
jgi:acetolactate synthase I/III small subunit